jgi:uncharacterized protein
MIPPNDVFDFPTAIPMKVIGRNENDFETFVLSTVGKHVEPADITAVSTRLSNGDKYLSVTITFTASSREHLETIYQEFSGHERVLMLI